MHLYSGTTTEFVSSAVRNLIGERLKEGFFRHFRYWPAASEVRSWKNSLKAMASAVELAGLDDHGVACEYQLPLSSRRLDVIITGHDADRHPRASLVELKQWDRAEASDIAECVTVYLGGGLREVLHPSVQAAQYRQYLADTHEAFSSGAIGLRASAFLHNFTHDPESELFAARHTPTLQTTPLFAGDRVDELAEWLREQLDGGGGVPLLESVLRGRYRPHKKLLTHTAKMIRGEPAYVLLDEQKVAFNAVLARVAEAHASDHKAVILVQGGPGTGKSVLAVNLVGALSAHGHVIHHATGSRAFTTNLRKAVGSRAAGVFKYFNSYAGEDPDVLDVLVLDEAHRIRQTSANIFTPKEKRTDEPQVDELLRVAKVLVFFIDDLQVVRPGEIGSSELIRQAARRASARLFEYQLEAQFRCAGSDAFIAWVENTLELRRTASVLWDLNEEFDFDVVDSPQELHALIKDKASHGNSARIVAGFCWPWSDALSDGSLVDDVKTGDFAMPWNARPDQKTAKGIPKSDLWATDPNGIDQVGCIYTAQGFEFDYVGVIFGRDLVHRRREGWVGRPEYSHDSVVRRSVSDGLDAFTRLVKQTYRVLLTRGLKGCYVYFEDDATRDFFLSRVERQVGTADREPQIAGLMSDLEHARE